MCIYCYSIPYYKCYQLCFVKSFFFRFIASHHFWSYVALFFFPQGELFTGILLFSVFFTEALLTIESLWFSYYQLYLFISIHSVNVIIYFVLPRSVRTLVPSQGVFFCCVFFFCPFMLFHCSKYHGMYMYHLYQCLWYYLASPQIF